MIILNNPNYFAIFFSFFCEKPIISLFINALTFFNDKIRLVYPFKE